MLFSVVIPTYNRKELVVEAIQSVVDQSYHDWELLICDDCSTDGTIEILRSKFPDKRIHFYSTAKNGGNAAARNIGIKHAKGAYVSFLDSDDTYYPEFLERMKALIEKNNQPGFLWVNVNRIGKDGEIKPNAFPKHWKPEHAQDPYAYFLKGIYFGTDFGLTVKKECFEKKITFDEQLRVAVDTDMIFRLVKEHNFSYTHDILVNTYDHAGSRVRNNTPEKAKSYAIIIKKHPIISQKKDLKLKWNYKLMWLNYHAGNKENARKHLYEIIKMGKFKPFLLAMVFELFSNEKAIYVHKKLSSLKE
jgi:glycosyltransferase involved in cell wall biosynthesis